MTRNVLRCLCTLLGFGLLVGPAMSSSANKNPNMVGGRYAMVELFEWRWDDIAEECERFLGPYGYGGLQVSPPTEHVIIMNPVYNPVIVRPWFERYQPVSYELANRSGDENGFKSMVDRCNKANVRVYVDSVINHMTARDTGEGTGTGGSYYNAATESFPAVPYTSADFHSCNVCPSSDCSIQSYNDATQVRNSRPTGLLDLDQSEANVRNKVTAYMNKLIGFGVAGFYLDDAECMWPDDIAAIVDSLDSLNTDYFPAGSKAYIYQEVNENDGEAVTPADYVGIGDVTDYKYGTGMAEVWLRQTQAKYLVNWGESASGPPGTNVLTFFDARMYKMANAFMLAHPYGDVRVMSSYYWPRDNENGQDVNSQIGPPIDSDYNILPVTINPDMTCGNGWACEHRWRQIYNMVRFRNAVGGTGQDNWWDNNGNQIAFSRGNKGFLVINNEESADLNRYLQTGLPAGQYCDVISGNLENGSCTGAVITVNGDGTAFFSISSSAEDPIVAIHADAKLS